MTAPNIVGVTSIFGITTAVGLTTTTTTTLLTNTAASNKVFKINSIIVSNIDGLTAANATVSWYNGTTDFKLAHLITVPSNSSLIVLGKDAPIYLQEGHSIRGGASAAGDLDCIISYEDIS